MILPEALAINAKHTGIYRLMMSEAKNEYIFLTDDGACYKIAFVEDNTIEGYTVYQLIIELYSGQTGRRDPKIQFTVSCIIEEFLATNETALLYICDTSDGRQEVRDRLFLRWFNAFADNALYTLMSESITVEGNKYFMSLLLRNDNLLYHPLLQAFETTCKELRERLDNCKRINMVKREKQANPESFSYNFRGSLHL